MLLFFLAGEMLSSDNEVIIVGCKQAVVRTIAPGGRHIFYFHIFAGIIGDKVAYHTVPFFYSSHTFGIMKQIAISAAQLIQITHIQGFILINGKYLFHHRIGRFSPVEQITRAAVGHQQRSAECIIIIERDKIKLVAGVEIKIEIV